MSFVNAADFGLSARNSGAENKIALQAAINTKKNVYIPEGVFNISGSVKMKENGQSLFGDNKWSTVLRVENSKDNLNDFNGTIDTNGTQYSAFRNFQIEFQQNLDAKNRNELIDYNPGIYIDAPRTILEDITIAKAMTGIQAVGNWGGLTAQDVEVGALEYGFDLGHSVENAHAKDTVHLDNVRVWPHKMFPNLTEIYYDGVVTGFGIGNVDDFKGSDMHPFRSKMVISGDDFFGQITGLSLDGERSKLIVDGEASLQVTGMYNAGTYKSPVFSQEENLIIVNADARLVVEGYELKSSGLSVPLVYVSSKDAVVHFSNGIVQQPNGNGQAFMVTDGHLGIHNTTFVWDDAWGVRNKYMIEAKGKNSSLTVTGSSMEDKPSDIQGNGGFIKTSNPDSNNLVVNNNDGGWGIVKIVDPKDRGTQKEPIEGSEANDMIVGSSNGDYVIGLSGRDTINGSGGDDTLKGQSGRDRIEGGSGSDEIYGGGARDIISGGKNQDTIIGGNGNDLLSGGNASDQIWGNAGRDTINGNYGEDFIRGGGSDDVLGGGKGSDHIRGGGGMDTIRGGADGDRLSGNAGDDVIHGDQGNDRIIGGSGNDTLVGEQGRDFIFGDSGDDLVLGKHGNDTISGGSGRDILYGGPGSDVFIFDKASDRVVIADFEAEYDAIHISTDAKRVDEFKVIDNDIVFRLDEDTVLVVRDANLFDVKEAIDWI